MTVYYLDFKDGNDSNDGTSFANRKKTILSFSSTPTGGDEIRVAGQPSTLVDANAKIYNCQGDGIYGSNRNISFTFSTTKGETSGSYSNHGMQTGDLIRIWNNTSHSTEDERPNGVWAVTRVDDNNFKLQEYTSPATGACDKTIVPSKSNPNPVLGVALSCGCCITPFTDTTSCADLVIFAFCPFV